MNTAGVTWSTHQKSNPTVPRHASLAGNMRTSGMIGGLGPESTVDYCRSIMRRFRALNPDGGYPQVIINSLDVSKGRAA
jgi:hypothetical protein